MEYKRLYVQPDTYFVSTIPHSEVCMHMRIAGERRICRLVGERMVQVYDRVLDLVDGHSPREFSAPITRGEAGVFTDPDGNPYVVVAQ